MLPSTHNPEIAAAVSAAHADLEALGCASEAEVGFVATAFDRLAAQVKIIVQHAGAIVDCIQDEDMHRVVNSVQSLSAAAIQALYQRLEAEVSILNTLNNEENLLKKLSEAVHRQDAVAAHLKALSVLTSIEVAKLGIWGGNFQILAGELRTFSNSVSTQTLKEKEQTELLRQTIADTARKMEADLPRLQNEVSKAEKDVESTLRVTESALDLMATAPLDFKACVEATSSQIGGLVAAIMSHDITRQQIEHVGQALLLIETGFAQQGWNDETRMATAYAGLMIQAGQLRNAGATVASWVSQIDRCTEGVQQLCVSKVTEVGARVLEQERELSRQIAGIELLQQKSHTYSRQLQEAFGKLTQLLALAGGQLQGAQTIRQRLRLLTFNSLIEASRLEERGAVVSAIANRIKDVSEEWSSIADDSRAALNEILKMVEQANKGMEVCSQAGLDSLRANRESARTALDNVRSIAATAAQEAAQMQAVTLEMQSGLSQDSDSKRKLSECFLALDAVAAGLQNLASGWKASDPSIDGRYDARAVESIFGDSYTTEAERAVLRAVLDGECLPLVAQESFAGNDVELF